MRCFKTYEISDLRFKEGSFFVLECKQFNNLIFKIDSDRFSFIYPDYNTSKKIPAIELDSDYTFIGWGHKNNACGKGMAVPLFNYVSGPFHKTRIRFATEEEINFIKTLRYD